MKTSIIFPNYERESEKNSQTDFRFDARIMTSKADSSECSGKNDRISKIFFFSFYLLSTNIRFEDAASIFSCLPDIYWTS